MRDKVKVKQQSKKRWIAWIEGKEKNRLSGKTELEVLKKLKKTIMQGERA